MHAQLQRLVSASKLDNVTIHVLPFTAGAHAGVDGEFTIFSYKKPEDPDIVYEDPDVVYVDNIGGGAYIEARKMTDRYNRTFERLVETALDSVKSAQILADVEVELSIQ